MTDENEINPQAAVDYILDHAKEYAQAKADRVYLMEFRKTKKAMLMNASDARTASDREAFAYSDPAYVEVLDGIKAAVVKEETLKFRLMAMELKVEVWRTIQANQRGQVEAAR